MKLPCLISSLGLLLALLSPPVLSAAEVVKFDVVLYLFKGSQIQMNLDKSRGMRLPVSGNGIAFSSPFTIELNHQELVLDGANYSWNGGRNIASGFSEAKMPAIITAFSQPATLRVDMPAQYLQKMPDGCLQLREVPSDAADAPRYQVTLEAREIPPDSRGDDLVLLCETDTFTVQARERIPGIELDVGKPVMVRINQKVEFRAKKGQWAGVLGSPKDDKGNNMLLMLFKPSVIENAPKP